MAFLNKFDRFHKTRLGYVVFGLIELALTYAAASWAIDSGSWWAYLLTLLFLIGFLQNVVWLVASFKRTKKGRR